MSGDTQTSKMRIQFAILARTLFGILAIIGGVYCALGIWFPGRRGRWGGGIITGTAKTNIVIGPISCAGFALLFISTGLMLLYGDAIPKSYRIGLSLCLPFSFILAVVGRTLDTPTAQRDWVLLRLRCLYSSLFS